jgi:RNA polymerase sigma factor (sigma-70 family)
MDRDGWLQAALNRYEKPLLQYAARITGDADAARDVVQHTFLRLCETERASIDGHLAAWLFTVTRNRALNLSKQEDRMRFFKEDEADAFQSMQPTPGEVVARSEMEQLIRATLDTLPSNQQEAFRLKFRDDLSYREISQIIGVSLGTVSNLITVALRAVRQRLEAEIDLAQEG